MNCADYVYYLGMHRDCRPQLLEYARELGNECIECCSEARAVLVRKMAREVMGELHRLRAFVRLSVSGGVLHGYAKPEHHIGIRLACALARRTTSKTIIVGNESESWIAFIKDQKAYARRGAPYPGVLGEFGVSPQSGGKLENFWRTYYSSQYVKSRKNPRLFGRNMPKKFLRAVRAQTEREYLQGNSKLVL